MISRLYINLDRSAERRAHMEVQLARIGMSAQRLAAIDGASVAKPGSPLKPGEIGCFLSHLEALKAAQRNGAIVHVMEDDIFLSKALASAEPTIAEALETFDIVYTDTFVNLDVWEIRERKLAFDAVKAGRAAPQVIDISELPFAMAASYFVSPRALPGIIAALERESASPQTPVDLLYRVMAQKAGLKAGCVFPFLTGQRLEEIAPTTIEGRAAQTGNASVLAAALLRYSFFIEADIKGYAQPFVEMVPGPAIPKGVEPHQALLMRVMGHVLSDHFRPF